MQQDEVKEYAFPSEIWLIIIGFIELSEREKWNGWGFASSALRSSLIFLSHTSKLLNLTCKKFLKTHRIIFRMYQKRIPAYLALNGHLQGLKYIRETGCAWDAKTCSNAAQNGHLDILIYARAQHCYWKAITCSEAALNGHLHVLKWATEHGCKKNHLVTTNAALMGHLDCLIYAHEHGYPWGTDTTLAAASTGQMSCLIYLHEHGCPWDSAVVQEAVENNNLDVLKYAVENKCRVRFCSAELAAKTGQVEMLKLLQKGLSPFKPAPLLRMAESNGHTAAVEYLRSLAWASTVILPNENPSQ